MTILFHNTTFDKIDVWNKTIKSKGIIEKSIKHLVDVSKKSITQAHKLDKKIYEIVKFVNKNILNRISKKIKD